MSSPNLSFFLNLAWYLPSVLIAFVGIALAILRWRYHPKASAAALAAYALLLITQMIWIGFFFWLQFGGGPDSTHHNHVTQVLRFSGLALSVVGQALLLAAIFGWRASPRPAQTLAPTDQL